MKISIAVAIILFPVLLYATEWATVSAGYIIRNADLVAVCKVIRCPWEEGGFHSIPCLIQIKLIKVLIGDEKDSDLMVNWGDYTFGYKNIKEGKEYVVFLERWDKIFPDKQAKAKSDRALKNLGVEIKCDYTRFNSEYSFREIINGEIIWTNNQKISVSNLVEMIRKEKNVANNRLQTTPLRGASEP
jgi:hypothetical protein